MYLHFSAVCLQFFRKKLLPLKHILALPTWGQKYLVSELQSFEIRNFDLVHPVVAKNDVLKHHSWYRWSKMCLSCHNNFCRLLIMQNFKSVFANRATCGQIKKKVFLDFACYGSKRIKVWASYWNTSQHKSW